MRRIGTTYNKQGLVDLTTSYSDNAGTTAVNQVKDVYNGFGQVIDEYQNHGWAGHSPGELADEILARQNLMRAMRQGLANVTDPEVAEAAQEALNDLMAQTQVIKNALWEKIGPELVKSFVESN